MRTFVIITFVLVASFGIHTLAIAAETSGTITPPAGNTRSAGTVDSSDVPSRGTSITLANPLNSGECAPNQNCLLNFLNKILAFVIKIGTVVVILMMVLVGYKFVAAQGAPDKIKEARDMLLWTVVGALILLGSQAIAKGIEATVRALSVGS